MDRGAWQATVHAVARVGHQLATKPPPPVIELGFCSGSVVKNMPAMQETQETRVQSLGQEDPLEKKMATHSSILAWEIPWTEKPGGLQSMDHKESDTTEVTEHENYKLNLLVMSQPVPDIDGWHRSMTCFPPKASAMSTATPP